ncbi:hypothetical protein M1O54_00030 [Dehalococcoidia bacterium]|nr:hypothetical protein [Dehalococcoidia bacterium]
MDDLSSKLRKDLESILGDEVEQSKTKREGLDETLVAELFDEAFACGVPLEKDRSQLMFVFNMLIENLSIRDALVLAFGLGRGYQKRMSQMEKENGKSGGDS